VCSTCATRKEYRGGGEREKLETAIGELSVSLLSSILYPFSLSFLFHFP
jgi:hypothetical protein